MIKQLCILFSLLIILSSCSKTDDDPAQTTAPPPDTTPQTTAADTAPQSTAAPLALTRDEKWIADVRQMQELYTSKHADPFFYTSQNVFDTRIDELIVKIPELSDTEIWLSMFQIINSLRDAHAYVYYPSSDFIRQSTFKFERFPFVVWKIKGEYYIISIDRRYEDMWEGIEGRRITAVNGWDIEQIDRSLHDFLPSELGSQYSISMSLYFYFSPTVLEFLGYPVFETNTITFAEQGGGTFTVDFPQLEVPDYRGKIKVRTPLNDNEEKFEFFTDDISGVARINYNTCSEQIQFIRFLQSSFAEITEKGYKKLIVDLRRNQGGELVHVGHLMRYLNEWEKLDENNHLYILIGDLTFSAGVAAARQLTDLIENSTLVGGGTAGTVDSFRMFIEEKLDNTGLVCRISTKGYGLERRVLLPDVYMENGIDDFIAGRDVAIEWVNSRP